MKVHEFRLISLVSSVYKIITKFLFLSKKKRIITKVLSMMLGEIIGDTMFENQSAFVAGRKILDAGLVANVINRFKTHDMLQIWRPNRALSFDVCVLCSGDLETNNHLFLHCEVPFNIWNRLFDMSEESWICLFNLGAFLTVKFMVFGRKKMIIKFCGNMQFLQFCCVFS